MKSGRVDDMGRWEKAKAYLAENNYKLWQFQYDVRDPHGFHAWFIAHELPDIEIITFNASVEEAIVSFNGERKR